MRIFATVVTAGILLALLTSCQKEADPSVPGFTQSDSTYFTELLVLDTTLPSGQDTALRCFVTYNSNKLQETASLVYYDPGGLPGKQESESYTYFYNGSNTQPYKVRLNYKDYTDPTNDYVDSTFYGYSNGNVIFDSTGGPTDFSRTNISQLGPTRYKMLQGHAFGPPPSLYIDTTYIYANWVNGNLTKEIDSLWSSAASLWDVSTSTMTYDNRPNPFKSLALPYPNPANSDIYSPGMGGIFLPTNNNIIVMTTDSGMDIFSYTYGNNNMPKLARVDELKVFYKYTKL